MITIYDRKHVKSREAARRKNTHIAHILETEHAITIIYQPAGLSGWRSNSSRRRKKKK